MGVDSKSTWCLALLCLISFGRASGMRSISEKMSQAIQKLNDHLNVTDKALFGNTIFLKDLSNLDANFEESEQKLLLHEILDVYVAILSDMLNHTEDNDVRMSIEEIKHRMMDLRRIHFQNKEKALKKRLQDLWAMKTSDVLVQRKAVRELLPVFQRVVELTTKKHSEHRRRRRQISQAQLQSGSGPILSQATKY